MIEIEQLINDAFENKESVSISTSGPIRDAIENTLNQLDNGSIRVCEKKDDEWKVNQWIKKAILLSFRINNNKVFKIKCTKTQLHN